MATKAPRSLHGCKTADQWNAKFPVGTPVRVWRGVREGPGDATKTHSKAFDLPSGHTVVQVEDRAGSIALTHVEPNDEPPI